MNDGIIPARPASYDKKVGLVLQGGGALGSYQGGVYEALAASEYLPDWVAGISIGAINAAVIAGNTPEHRVQRLRSFWEEITASTSLWHSAADGPIVEWQQWAGAFTALMFGQPGFFEPRKPHDWFHQIKASVTTKLLHSKEHWNGLSISIGSTMRGRCD
jgi:NTE family protein